MSSSHSHTYSSFFAFKAKLFTKRLVIEFIRSYLIVLINRIVSSTNNSLPPPIGKSE